MHHRFLEGPGHARILCYQNSLPLSLSARHVLRAPSESGLGTQQRRFGAAFISSRVGGRCQSRASDKFSQLLLFEVRAGKHLPARLGYATHVPLDFPAASETHHSSYPSVRSTRRL
jgi:hypothetical protein